MEKFFERLLEISPVAFVAIGILFFVGKFAVKLIDKHNEQSERRERETAERCANERRADAERCAEQTATLSERVKEVEDRQIKSTERIAEQSAEAVRELARALREGGSGAHRAVQKLDHA